MRPSELRGLLAAALVAAAIPAAACGFCIEDRVAAVYDSAAIESAVAKRQHVAFLAVDGDIALDAATQKALVKALEAAGAQRGATRVAGENAAVAVVFDPKRTTLSRLVAAGDKALASSHRTVKALRIIDDGGRLREPEAG